MREEKRMAYAHITRGHDGAVTVSALIETCLIDDEGKIVGVKPPGETVDLAFGAADPGYATAQHEIDGIAEMMERALERAQAATAAHDAGAAKLQGHIADAHAARITRHAALAAERAAKGKAS